MGLLTIIKKQKLKDKELRVLLLGLDNAGKTTIVKKILQEDIQEVSPTMGFQISTVLYKGFNLNIWDIGGQTSLRTFWGNYFEKTNVVVWVIDALALNRLGESYRELRDKVVEQDRLEGVSLLVLVNKIDAVEDGEKIRQQVEAELGLGGGNWRVMTVSGKTGEGVVEAMEWCVGSGQ